MNIKTRIYEDYFKKSRLPEYKKLLLLAKDHGYLMMGTLELYKYIEEGGGTDLILVNRHDIDTSPRVAREMFEIEQEVYGTQGSATYYFRDSTIDIGLIQDIEAYGYETGYHFETIANFEKKNKTKKRSAIEKAFPMIKSQLEDELVQYRNKTHTKSQTISAHGDWINVSYGISGNRILSKETREKLGILATADDKCLQQYTPARFFDMELLDQFIPRVKEAVLNREPGVLILTHPRNWKTDIFFNTKDNIKRIVEDISYRL